nr:uncharacterized protein LOC128696227 [Cherax quadricarinatus]
MGSEQPPSRSAGVTQGRSVIDLPDEEPRISDTGVSHQLHEEVVLNCSSPRSQPPASLTFYVNQELADPGWLILYQPLEDPESGLETSILGLRFPLRPRLLHRGKVSVKCTASIFNIYFRSTEAFVQADIPFHASIMEGRAAVGRGCPASASSVLTVMTSGVLLLINY